MYENLTIQNEICLNSLRVSILMNSYIKKRSFDTNPDYLSDKKIKYKDVPELIELINHIKSFFSYVKDLDKYKENKHFTILEDHFNRFLDHFDGKKSIEKNMILIDITSSFSIFLKSLFDFNKSLYTDYNNKISIIDDHNSLFFNEFNKNTEKFIRISEKIDIKKLSDNAKLFHNSFESTFQNALDLYWKLIRTTFDDDPSKESEIKSYSSSVLFILVSAYEKLIYLIAYQLGFEKKVGEINLTNSLKFIEEKNQKIHKKITKSDRYMGIQTARNLRNAETHRLAIKSFPEINGYNSTILIEINNILELITKILE